MSRDHPATRPSGSRQLWIGIGTHDTPHSPVRRMNQSELERQAAAPAPAGGGGRDSGLTNPGADLSSADQQSQGEASRTSAVSLL